MSPKGHHGVYFAFPHKDIMDRFIELYGDLFIPYSEVYVKTNFKWCLHNANHTMIEKGYIIDPLRIHENIIRVNLTNENLKIILKCSNFEIKHYKYTYPNRIRVYVFNK